MTESAKLPEPFTTLAAQHRHGEVVENSEFLAYARRADTPEEALAFLAELRAKYPDATHHCWAYRIGEAYRFNDDGEPGGTAGAPLLRAIEGQGVQHVMVVVVRYYGGVKLGTGGLVRAYGGAAAEVLRTAERFEVRPRLHTRVSVGFAEQGALYHLLDTWDVVKGEEVYTPKGVTVPLEVYPEDEAGFTQALEDATRGSGVLEVLGPAEES
ncbi:IMPACT family protein [Deinococcus sp. SL84]|uniref:IMPACT family protein n=1 Tax=Deinococcus sp. SL84 TaxID=2994663 RepID=UPI0022735754|nr:YigZ family protein [Deinococcus sp. SL84]MCY1702776.1 IMPACT family protein [Deinococcus sp. SL84]